MASVAVHDDRVRDRERTKIILLRVDGLGVEAVAERLNTTPKRVSMWSVCFAGSGLDGLASHVAIIVPESVAQDHKGGN